MIQRVTDVNSFNPGQHVSVNPTVPLLISFDSSTNSGAMRSTGALPTIDVTGNVYKSKDHCMSKHFPASGKKAIWRKLNINNAPTQQL